MENKKQTINGWARILLLIIPYFFVVGIFQFIGMLIADIDYKQLDAVKTTEQHLIISFFGLVGSLIILWIFMKFIDNEPFINLGFHFKKRINDVIIGLSMGLLVMGIGYLILISIDEIHYTAIVFSLKDFVLSILVYIIVAVVEEVLFRGYILRNLMYSFNKYVALIVSSLLFSLMHGFNPNMDWFSYLDLFLAGLLLGCLLYTSPSPRD